MERTQGGREVEDAGLTPSAGLLRATWTGGSAGAVEDRRLLEEMLEHAGAAGFAQGAAALVPEAAMGLAVLGDRDAVMVSEGAFAVWFPQAAAMAELRRLAAEARRAGSAIGFLETADGAAVATWAVCGAPARKWARSEAARSEAAEPGRVLVLVFAPSTSGALAARAVAAFGLSPLESRLAEALLFAPNLEIAGSQAGVGRETARDAMARIMAKTGARRSADVVRRLADLMSGAPDTGQATAELTAEQLVSVAEPVFTAGAPPARLRLLPRPNGRQMAFLDYGPASGRPAMLFHGFMAGRSLPTALARALQIRGVRPIVLQRPGFGLTSPADGDDLDCGTADRKALMDALGFDQVTIFARDGGTAAALAFASAFPEAITRGVLMNPRSPLGLPRTGTVKPVSRLARAILSQPQAIAGLGELIRRRTRSDYLEASLRQTLRGHPGDIAALEDPAVRAQLVRDIQAQFAHSSAGYVAEHRLYARGWKVPAVAGGGPWTVVSLGVFGDEPPRSPWLELPGVSFESLPDAGVLAQFTHAQQLAALIAG